MANFIVIASKQDLAGMNIAKFLEKEKVKTHYVEEDIINCENVDKKKEVKDADFLVFASRHKSVDKRKTLSVHPIGNWHKAEYGGKENTASMASAFLIKTFFINLNKIAEKEKTEYEITMECTHHGPYIEKPCLFIEVGSSEEEWKDLKACKIIADTIIETIKNYKPKFWIPAIAIGGRHYCNNFNKIQLNSEYSISHVIPEYALPIDKKIINEAINKTIEPVKTIILDWKGLGKSKIKQQTLNLLNSINLKIIRTKEAKK